MAKPINPKFLDENGLKVVKQYLDENKQNILVSGENIKTINGESVLGSGDIIVGGGDDTNITVIGNCDELNNKIQGSGVFYLEEPPEEGIPMASCDYRDFNDEGVWFLTMNTDIYNQLLNTVVETIPSSITVQNDETDWTKLQLISFNSDHTFTEENDQVTNTYVYNGTFINSGSGTQCNISLRLISNNGQSLSSDIISTPVLDPITSMNEVLVDGVVGNPDCRILKGEFSVRETLLALDPELLLSYITESMDLGPIPMFRDTFGRMYYLETTSPTSADLTITNPNMGYDGLEVAYADEQSFILYTSVAVETDEETGGPYIVVGDMMKPDEMPYATTDSVQSMIDAAIGDVLNTDF